MTYNSSKNINIGITNGISSSVYNGRLYVLDDRKTIRSWSLSDGTSRVEYTETNSRNSYASIFVNATGMYVFGEQRSTFFTNIAVFLIRRELNAWFRTTLHAFSDISSPGGRGLTGDSSNFYGLDRRNNIKKAAISSPQTAIATAAIDSSFGTPRGIHYNDGDLLVVFRNRTIKGYSSSNLSRKSSIDRTTLTDIPSTVEIEGIAGNDVNIYILTNTNTVYAYDTASLISIPTIEAGTPSINFSITQTQTKFLELVRDSSGDITNLGGRGFYYVGDSDLLFSISRRSGDVKAKHSNNTTYGGGDSVILDYSTISGAPSITGASFESVDYHNNVLSLGEINNRRIIRFNKGANFRTWTYRDTLSFGFLPRGLTTDANGFYWATDTLQIYKIAFDGTILNTYDDGLAGFGPHAITFYKDHLIGSVFGRPAFNEPARIRGWNLDGSRDSLFDSSTTFFANEGLPARAVRGFAAKGDSGIYIPVGSTVRFYTPPPGISATFTAGSPTLNVNVSGEQALYFEIEAGVPTLSFPTFNTILPKFRLRNTYDSRNTGALGFQGGQLLNARDGSVFFDIYDPELNFVSRQRIGNPIGSIAANEDFIFIGSRESNIIIINRNNFEFVRRISLGVLNPQGIAVIGQHIYVADLSSRRIIRFNFQGLRLSEFHVAELGRLTGMAAYLGDLYIVSYDRNNIVCYGTDGTRKESQDIDSGLIEAQLGETRLGFNAITFSDIGVYLGSSLQNKIYFLELTTPVFSLESGSPTFEDFNFETQIFKFRKYKANITGNVDIDRENLEITGIAKKNDKFYVLDNNSKKIYGDSEEIDITHRIDNYTEGDQVDVYGLVYYNDDFYFGYDFRNKLIEERKKTRKDAYKGDTFIFQPQAPIDRIVLENCRNVFRNYNFPVEGTTQDPRRPSNVPNTARRNIRGNGYFWSWTTFEQVCDERVNSVPQPDLRVDIKINKYRNVEYDDSIYRKVNDFKIKNLDGTFSKSFDSEVKGLTEKNGTFYAIIGDTLDIFDLFGNERAYELPSNCRGIGGSRETLYIGRNDNEIISRRTDDPDQTDFFHQIDPQVFQRVPNFQISDIYLDDLNIFVSSLNTNRIRNFVPDELLFDFRAGSPTLKIPIKSGDGIFNSDDVISAGYPTMDVGITVTKAIPLGTESAGVPTIDFSVGGINPDRQLAFDLSAGSPTMSVSPSLGITKIPFSLSAGTPSMSVDVRNVPVRKIKMMASAGSPTMNVGILRNEIVSIEKFTISLSSLHSKRTGTLDYFKPKGKWVYEFVREHPAGTHPGDNTNIPFSGPTLVFRPNEEDENAQVRTPEAPEVNNRGE